MVSPGFLELADTNIKQTVARKSDHEKITNLLNVIAETVNSSAATPDGEYVIPGRCIHEMRKILVSRGVGR